MTTEPEVNPEDVEVVPGSPEYNEAMAAKFREARGETTDQVEQPSEETPQKPEWCPEKFWKDGKVDTEGLAKSYAEIEKTRSKPEEKTEETPAEDDKSAKDAVEEAGLDWDSIRGKAMKDGKLDETDYEALEGIGIPQELVEEYIGLLNYRIEKNQEAAIDAVGGEDKMAQLMTWASENLTPDEIHAYNSQLQGAQWRTALDTLMFRQSRSRPGANEPTLHTGSAPSGGGGGYSSRAQMKQDMASPQYRTDPAFRAEVARKISVSKWENDN